ncbi:small integral membrane protein 29-like [Gigantopelta aegis]|uniref:small integral membrane protein 29-like n=1 Tax=Gigantopelta aegis TaxID=1735272 RepID=UPI001B887860|nr:small integral membrane protein 29-like [Gigantopelta aegis]
MVSGFNTSSNIDNTTNVNLDLPDAGMSSNQVLIYVLVPIGSIIFIVLIIILIIFILKKNRLDKLRHHLMPLYSFDPHEVEGDWESELLEEEREQQMRLRMESPSPSDSPTLKLSSMHSEL